MSSRPRFPAAAAGQELPEYAVELFYRATEAALDPAPARRAEAPALFWLAEAVLAAAEGADTANPRLAAANACPTAELRSQHPAGWA
jgi:hypothetical protein